MSRHNWWLENAAVQQGPLPHVLIDFGYVKDESARMNADRVLAVLGKANLQLVGFGRIVIRVPPTKVTRVLEQFPEIHEGDGYRWTTHRFGDGRQFGDPA